MDNEFLPSGQMKISYQIGMDGARRSFMLPRWIFVALIAVAAAMLISTVILFIVLGGSAARETRLNKLETENRSLRTKVEFYASAVDSIYVKLDSMRVDTEEESRDYPSLGLGKTDQKTDFSYDPALKQRINSLESKLAYILHEIGPEEQYVTPTLAELGAGELPPDYMPSIYPTFGRISDGWGLRVHPITNEIEFHFGIDIANQPGTPIYATASGIVVKTDFDLGYGKRILIDHGNGYQTLYGHLYSYLVRVGDEVGKGQIIGLMGNSGTSTGPHLHYEVRNAEGKVNPTAYLNRIDEPALALR